LNTNGFFIYNNIKVGQNKEVDLLAIQLEKGNLKRFLHVEVHCSISPSRRLDELKSVEKNVLNFIKKTFDDQLISKKIQEMISKYSDNQDYEKVLVLGSLSKQSRKKVISELEKKGVKVIRFEEILFEVLLKLDRQVYKSETIRTLQLVKFLLMSDPKRMAVLLGDRQSDDILNLNTRETFLYELFKQKEVLRIFGKVRFENSVVKMLKASTIRRPERLADSLSEVISRRSLKKIAELLTIRTSSKKPKRKVKKEKSLFSYMKT